MSEERSDEDDDVNGLGCGCLLVPHGTAIRRLCKWHEATTFPKTWAGFRAFLDEVYPDDIFPDKGRDLGPSFVVAARRLSEVESEVRSLRGVVQAVADAVELLRLDVVGKRGYPLRALDHLDRLRAALAAAADAPQPSDDDEGIAHVTETYRQTISGWEQLGWECVTCGRLEFVVAGPGMGKAVPAADLALLERLAAKHVREASAGPSPAVLPQPSKESK